MPRATQEREAAAPASRLFTPRSSFTTVQDGRSIVLRPGELVNEGDPIYQRFPHKFRDPQVRRY